MAYTYTPYEYQSAIGPRPRFDDYEGQWSTNETGPQWDIRKTEDQRSQFQDYAGQQFKSLFDIANINANQLQGFSQTPAYSPYGGTRSDFTTPGGFTYDEDSRQVPFAPKFDQQGYLDARFGNINDYLGGLSSFLSNMSGNSGMAVRQAEAQRAMNRANMPTIGMSQPMGTPQMGGTSALSGFGGGGGRLIGKGWGSHPAFKGLLSGGSGE